MTPSSNEIKSDDDILTSDVNIDVIDTPTSVDKEANNNLDENLLNSNHNSNNHNNPCILFLDSLGIHGLNSIAGNIYRYDFF